MAFLDGLRELFSPTRAPQNNAPAVQYSAPVSRGVRSSYYFAPTRPSTRRELATFGYSDISRSRVAEQTAQGTADAPSTADFISRVLAAFGRPAGSGGVAFTFDPIAPVIGGVGTGGQDAPVVQQPAPVDIITQIINALTPGGTGPSNPIIPSTPSGSVVAPPTFTPADVNGNPAGGGLLGLGSDGMGGQTRGGGRGAVPG